MAVSERRALWWPAVRELIHHAQLRTTPQDGIEVHLLEHHAAIFDSPSRHDFQIADLRFSLGPPVGLDEPHDDIDALAPERMRILQHRIGLADAWRGSDVDAEASALIGLELGEQLFAAGSGSLRHHVMLRGIRQTRRWP